MSDLSFPVATLVDIQRWAALVVLFSVRPLIAFVIIPATAAPMLTATTRTLLAVSFGAYAATGVFLGGGRVPAGSEMFATFALREAAIGFTVGFAAAKVFWGAQCIGAMLDNVTGYNNVQLTNPASPDQCTPISDLLLHLVVTLFWGFGGMLVVFGALIETHRWWPVTAPLPQGPVWTLPIAISSIADLARLVASVATPMLFLIALIDIVFGLVSRAAKNVDTNTVATPLRSAAALLSLALYCSVFLQDIQGYLALSDLQRLLGMWKGAS